jgi:hypothetical protein
MMEMLINSLLFWATILAEIIPLFLVVTFLAGLALEYISAETLRRNLGGKGSISGTLLATFFGFITPFCSCSTIPVVGGMIAAGIPIGIITAFLFASPYPVEVALIMLGPLFGWAFAAIFCAAGVAIAILTGITIQKLGWQDQVKSVASLIGGSESNNAEDPQISREAFKAKAKRAVVYAFSFLKKQIGYIIVGSAIGAFIYGFLPTDLVLTYAGGSSIFAVPIAALIGVPLYVSIIPVIPIVFSLYLKGLSAGAVIAFLITATAISPPELIMLSGMFKKKYIAAFIVVMIAGSIVTGYLFNAI